MTIATDTIYEHLPSAIVGAAAGLMLATVIPAGVVLATGTVAVAGTLAYRKWNKIRKDTSCGGTAGNQIPVENNGNDKKEND